MTGINFYSNSGGELLGFKSVGHSGYADKGQDILCAYVSSSVLMAANTITEILHINAEIEEGDAYLKLRLKQHEAEVCAPILQGLLLHLTTLEKQYPNYLKITTTEV
ncbi:MAG: ribosomal-processing cysteine protease Prp [Oscillospiraceae bacterium]|jgi:uncharacterized protein YsxB (DUF464 family)|nr:ribosomal-processing cysteine protease Prp [Oscillospiraceae bacterium]